MTEDGVAVCWGGNTQGQVGDGTRTARTEPTVVAMPAPTTVFLSIHTQHEHTCGLSTGPLYCWGLNSAGHLGNGTTTTRETPTAVTMSTGSTFLSVMAGFEHSCSLTSGGAAYCWGFNLDGQIGDGTTTTRLTPVPVTLPSGVTFVAIGAGNEFTCALTLAGTLYCWGANSFGRLGDGTLVDRSTPTPVASAGLLFYRSSIGPDHSCALTPAGAAYCWGYNPHGAIGDGTTAHRLTPTAVAMPSGVSFDAIATGGMHSCALSSGSVLCWGDNRSGQIGDGTTTARLTPVAIAMPAGVSFKRLALGLVHSCAIASDGDAYCWGNNDSGQLGDGTTTSRLTPVRVMSATR